MNCFPKHNIASGDNISDHHHHSLCCILILTVLNRFLICLLHNITPSPILHPAPAADAASCDARGPAAAAAADSARRRLGCGCGCRSPRGAPPRHLLARHRRALPPAPRRAPPRSPSQPRAGPGKALLLVSDARPAANPCVTWRLATRREPVQPRCWWGRSSRSGGSGTSQPSGGLPPGPRRPNQPKPPAATGPQPPHAAPRCAQPAAPGALQLCPTRRPSPPAARSR